MKGRAARCVVIGLTLAVGACDALSTGLDGDRGRSTLNLAALEASNTPTYVETDANDGFESAEKVTVGESPVIIKGDLGSITDVDVYDIGPVLAGDRVRVEVSADEGMSGAIALFDAAGTALLVNDHRNVYLERKGPFVDVVIRRSAASCYVVFASTPGFAATGDYALVATIDYREPIPIPKRDVVLLDFAGANGVTIGSRSAINVPAFDAANISSGFRNQTDAMVKLIVANIRESFAGLDLTILSTSEGATYDGAMSRLFFGTYDSALLGVAEGVDEYNSRTRQEAIVFADTFAAFDRLSPSTEEMARALANVASHEIGHLLGLIHTWDPQGIMDVTASLSELLRPQTFAVSPLYAAVFPIGDQDSVRLLLDSIGGEASVARAQSLRTLQKALARPDDGQPPARNTHMFGSCGLDHQH